MPSATERPTRCKLPQRFCKLIRATVGRRQSGGCPNLHPQNALSAHVGSIPDKREKEIPVVQSASGANLNPQKGRPARQNHPSQGESPSGRVTLTLPPSSSSFLLFPKVPHPAESCYPKVCVSRRTSAAGRVSYGFGSAGIAFGGLRAAGRGSRNYQGCGRVDGPRRRDGRQTLG